VDEGRRKERERGKRSACPHQTAGEKKVEMTAAGMAKKAVEEDVDDVDDDDA